MGLDTVKLVIAIGDAIEVRIGNALNTAGKTNFFIADIMFTF